MQILKNVFQKCALNAGIEKVGGKYTHFPYILTSYEHTDLNLCNKQGW